MMVGVVAVVAAVAIQDHCKTACSLAVGSAFEVAVEEEAAADSSKAAAYTAAVATIAEERDSSLVVVP